MSVEGFQISKGFSKILLIVAGMNLQMFYSSRQISQLRKKIFNIQFMKANYGEKHVEQLKQQISASGHPDNGSGLYSKKLSYRDWYRLNVLQRIHKNYLQNINLATISVISAGIYNPNIGCGVGLTYILGRFIYSLFYKRQKGARNPGRIVGVVLCHLATIVGFAVFLRNFIK